jgi:hypothetical protein
VPTLLSTRESHGLDKRFAIKERNLNDLEYGKVAKDI